MNHPEKSPKIGISACLLGHRVRYNGDGKPNDWILDQLAPFVQFAPFCPEMAMGLGAPRETLRLVKTRLGDPTEKPRLIGNQSGRDLTTEATDAAKKIISELSELDGIILKKASPTCGLEKVKVYGRDGIPQAQGRGIFAEEIRQAFPTIPTIEEGRLTDPQQRELFLTQVFALHSFKRRTQMLAQELAQKLEVKRHSSPISELQSFHQQHKFLLLSHDPEAYSRLGRIAANPDSIPAQEACQLYHLELARALSTPPSPGKRINALQHLFGFFKNSVNSEEKEHFLALLEEYRAGLRPFGTALSLVEHLCRRFNHAYLLNQVIFYPFPLSLNK